MTISPGHKRLAYQENCGIDPAADRQPCILLDDVSAPNAAADYRDKFRHPASGQPPRQQYVTNNRLTCHGRVSHAPHPPPPDNPIPRSGQSTIHAQS